MKVIGKKNPQANLNYLGFQDDSVEFWNLLPEELVEITLKQGLGYLSDKGAIAVNTGEFTGRSPKDRFIVLDPTTENTVDWNDINMPFDGEKFDQLQEKMVEYLKGKDIYIRDSYACADDDYRLNLRLITEFPWSNQFGYNMFLRLTEQELMAFEPEWNIICAPGFYADPEVDGTRKGNFAILNFGKKTVLIGGTAYTGEIKKGIFSALNFILPTYNNVLSMHCSANTDEKNGTAVFFGLSGTGKTTLSADPDRALIGDDEHGWSDNGVFNFEGGCYAKTIDLTPEKEPQIYHAIRHGAIIENMNFVEGTRTPDFLDDSITQNIRVSYPIYHIDNALEKSQGDHPKNIFFLTCDAFGVLPPISRLTKSQAMYHFISGYTAKVAGTEAGIEEPETTFSACFGAPFLPLHPTKYAEMLGERMEKYNVNVWLVNTGWTKGPHGVGHRINLSYTRAMVTAALNGELDNVEYAHHDVFGLDTPVTVPNVPSEVLNPRDTWEDKAAYDEKAAELARSFVNNFKKFEDKASAEILAAAPKVSQEA